MTAAAAASCDITTAAWPRAARDEESRRLAVPAGQLDAPGLAEPPPEQELWGRPPDPAGDRPCGADDGSAAERAACPPGPFPAGSPGPFPAGSPVGDGGGAGGGFADGGVLDVLPPGVVLAGCAGDAWAGGLGGLSDDELIGVVRAWRRLSSWAAAGELAAVAGLSARRERDPQADPASQGCRPADCVAAELACALTLTRRSAENLADRAAQLTGLPATAAALRLGRIDMPRALTVIDGVAGLGPRLARAVEDRVLASAPGQTTGELRAAVRRAVMAADPAAAARRRENAEKDARVELWDEAAGTKALAGRDLPPAQVLAADKRISAIARELKNRGAPAGLGVLRANVYLALLAGQPLGHLLPAPAGPGQQASPAAPARAGGAGSSTQGSAADPGAGAGPDGGSDSDEGAHLDAKTDASTSADRGATETGDGAAPVAGADVLGPLGCVAGSVNLTVPLTTLLDLADAPGEVAGFGPVDAQTGRILAGAAARHPANRWCLSVIDDNGRVIGHGCRRQRAGPGRTW